MRRVLMSANAPVGMWRALLLSAAIAPALASCQLVGGSDAHGETSPPTSTESAANDGEPTTTAPVATTVAPDTTVSTVAPTTVAPTTVAPTTAAPTTTEAPAPRNIVEVPPPLVPFVAVGSSDGHETERIQKRLFQLGFWVGNSNGNYELTTRQAVMAFQKYMRIEATGRVDRDTAAYLTAWTERAHGRADVGTMVEVDKARQVLFIVKDGYPLWTFNVSTGSEKPYIEVNKSDPTKIEVGDAVTDNGLFEVNRERAEGWWAGDLGEIYRPKYFNGGIAVHGSNNVPNYPASHGCVRVSVPAMDFIWDANLLPMNIPVWVHS